MIYAILANNTAHFSSKGEKNEERLAKSDQPFNMDQTKRVD